MRRDPDQWHEDVRQTEVAGKKQPAAGIYLRLELASRPYVVLLLPYVEAIRRALGEGADTIEEVQRYLPDISNKVREVQKRVGSNLDRSIDLIQKNEWLDEATQEWESGSNAPVRVGRNRSLIPHPVSCFWRLAR